MRTLTLLVGNAFMPHGNEQDKRHPAIESFLARSTTRIHRHISTAGWICTVFGVKRQPDWPVGAILTHMHEASDDHAYWICADPVHLAADRDKLVLHQQSQLQLTHSESQELFTALGAHFASEGLHFVHADSGRWCVATRHRAHLVTTDLELVEGRDVNECLPSGQDGPIWQRYMTEAQMILHDHPVNAARELRGQPVVNSVWIWGGGGVPATIRRFDKLSVCDSLLRELGKLSGADVSTLTAPGIEFCISGDNLAEFPLRQSDDDVVARLQSHWIVPAWQALRNGELDNVTLVVRVAGAMVEFSCDRQARRRFWKRRSPLSDTIAKLQATL